MATKKVQRHPRQATSAAGPGVVLAEPGSKAVEAVDNALEGTTTVPPAGRPEKKSARARTLSEGIRGLEGFRLWSQVERPMILRTRITSLNRAMKCGGIPGGMLGVLHGPSQGGKSLLGAEIVHAAWATGGWGLIEDAECRAVDLKWYQQICANLDEVAYYKPRTFEDAIDRTEKFRRKFRAAKVDGKIPPGGMLAIVIDSVTRLAPSTELEELMEGTMAARGYPLRALMASRWLDRLMPTLERDEVVAFVTREGKKLDAQPGQKQYTVKGGVAQTFDAGWVWRVTAAGRVFLDKKGKDGEEDGKLLLGEKHEIEVLKNSMGPHLDELANFYSAVGRAGEPMGFDFIREVREETLLRGLVKHPTALSYELEGERVATSKAEFLTFLRGQKDGPEGETWWQHFADKLDAEWAVDGAG